MVILTDTKKEIKWSRKSRFEMCVMECRVVSEVRQTAECEVQKVRDHSRFSCWLLRLV